MHLFGSYGLDPTTLTTLTTDYSAEIEANWNPQSEDGRPRLWHVSSALLERQRFWDGQNPLAPLDLTEVQREEMSWSQRSLLKLKIGVSGMGLPQQPYLIDLDHSLVLYATRLSLSVLGPPGTQNVARPNRALEATGVVFDTFVGAKVLAMEESGLASPARLTENLYIGENTQGVIRVPRGARTLNVYESPDGGHSTGRWQFLTNDPVVGAPFQLSGFDIPASGVSPTIAVPAATHLRTDQDASDRLFQLVWTIQP